MTASQRILNLWSGSDPGVTGAGGSPLPEPAGAKVAIMLDIICSMFFMPDCMSVIVVSIVDIFV